MTPSSPTVQCGPAAAVQTVFPRSQCITSPVSCSRLDCGTGPGLVRSRHRVQLRAWNHLAVFRHDWAVWLQLNRGPREEGRSQVGTLGWAGELVMQSLNLGFKSQSFHSNSLRMLHFHCRPLIQSVLFMNIKPVDLRRDSSPG